MRRSEPDAEAIMNGSTARSRAQSHAILTNRVLPPPFFTQDASQREVDNSFLWINSQGSAAFTFSFWVRPCLSKLTAPCQMPLEGEILSRDAPAGFRPSHSGNQTQDLNKRSVSPRHPQA